MQMFFGKVFPIIRKKMKIIKEHLLFCCGFVNFAHQLIKMKKRYEKTGCCCIPCHFFSK